MNLPKSNPMLPSSYSIERVTKETDEVFTLELEPVKGDKNFSFKPGQFNMLYQFGVGEVPISISGDPSQSGRLIHTIRATGTVTGQMKNMKKGDILGVRGPYGSPWPVEEARGKDIVLVTGGIGLAPLRPVIYQLLSEREQFGKINILYGTRSPADILYKKELERWRKRFDLEVEVTVDRAERDWKGTVGVVTCLMPKAFFDPGNTVAMICGPEVMMKFVVLELKKHGLTAEDIYISMERNMKCAVGFCGHCQFGPNFICKDGPVFRFDRVHHLFARREV